VLSVYEVLLANEAWACVAAYLLSSGVLSVYEVLRANEVWTCALSVVGFCCSLLSSTVHISEEL